MKSKIYNKINKMAKNETPEFWDKIEANLPEQEGLPIRTKKQANFSKFGLVAACLVIAAVSFYTLGSNSPVKNFNTAADKSRNSGENQMIAEDSKDIGRPDIYQPIVKDVTLAEMNKQLGINFKELSDIPKDLTNKKIQLYYYDDKVINAQLSYKKDDNRYINIHIYKLEIKEPVIESGEQTPPVVAPDVIEKSREYDNDSTVTNDADSSVPTDLPADGGNGQSSPPSVGSGDYKGDYKFEEEILKINSINVSINKMINTKTGDVNFYTNITKDNINYYIETKNITVDEVKVILIQL